MTNSMTADAQSATDEIDVSKIVPINRISFADKLRAYAKKPFSLVLLVLIAAAAAITAALVVWIVGYTLVQGVPNLKGSLFAWEYTSDNVSMMPAIINTLFLAGVTILIAAPLGVFAAIFMVEYAKSTNIFVRIVRMAAETLSGIPSIVFGIFGMIFFVDVCGWGYSMIAGILTMVLMTLPLIMRTAEEALKAVPDSFREGSYALGAGKLRTIFVILLPAALSGVVSGIILALGRVVGETAALIYTSGSSRKLAGGFGASGETLAIHMYFLANEGLHVGEAWATAVVLIGLVVLINALAEFVGNKLKKEY